MNDLSSKIASINIEGDKHLDRVIPFLQSQNFDVICLQEVLNKDVSLFKKELEMDAKYYPSVYFGSENRGGITPGNLWGILTLVKKDCSSFFSHTYVGSEKDIPHFDNDNFNRVNRILAGVEYKFGGDVFRILTTHFTWIPDGKTNDEQRNDYKKLLQYLDLYDEFVLCGDFNAPRGQEIWDSLAQKYTDNTPQEILTTMDQNLHKVKGLQLVVDGMFSTSQYVVKNVVVQDGLSDHMATYATVSKK
jgi:endonuclease/exonuclease/phosphatase family metal-dependent hydrolase